MITYITAFIFYTLAMIGILLVGFIVYKKFILNGKTTAKSMIKVLDSISIAPKKNLLVVKVKNEKFLIASDSERTTFLARLSEENTKKDQKTNSQETKQEQYKPKINQNIFQTKEQKQDTQINQESAQIHNLQQERLNKIQKQFQMLYDSEFNQEQASSQPTRKEMVKKLLRELNDATNTKVSGGY